MRSCSYLNEQLCSRCETSPQPLMPSSARYQADREAELNECTTMPLTPFSVHPCDADKQAKPVLFHIHRNTPTHSRTLTHKIIYNAATGAYHRMITSIRQLDLLNINIGRQQERGNTNNDLLMRLSKLYILTLWRSTFAIYEQSIQYSQTYKCNQEFEGCALCHCGRDKCLQRRCAGLTSFLIVSFLNKRACTYLFKYIFWGI